MSKKLYKKALTLIPGGTMLFSKKPELYLPSKWPTYYSKCKGINIWDISNNKLNDFYFGVGQNTLGYCNKNVDSKVIKACKDGNMSSLNCTEEVKLAEKLVELHPWSDMVKFARSGGEINSIAMRIARAASGNDKVAICGYHGWHDWYLAANINNNKNLNQHIIKGLNPLGVPNNLKNTTFPFSYNNIEQLKKIIKEHKIGTIMMEEQRDKKPENNFLKKVKELCKKNKIILIFDECTSGFRQCLGGLHKVYKVQPDMAIFGKALGNGYAITALIGKKEIMNVAQKTFISSTFWTERIGYAAGLSTLSEMNKVKSWEIISKNGRLVKKLWKEIATNNNLNISISGIDALPIFQFDENHLEYKTLMTQEMLKNKYLVSNVIFMSTLHDEKKIYKYIDFLEKAFKIIKRCKEGEPIKKFLKSEVSYSPFDRLN